MNTTYREAFRAGWAASKRTTTFDMDAACDRFERKHGSATAGAFIGGWSAYATGEYATETLAWNTTALNRWHMAVGAQ